MWPTLVANDDNKSPEAHMAMKQRMKGGPCKTITSLNVMVKAISQYERSSVPLNAQAGGSLNPTWVEWLMGFPLGWTDCGPSATPSSRRSRK